MKLFKNKYKELYFIELENRKKYEKRYREIKKENEDLQVEKGYAELNQKVEKLMNDNYDLGCEVRTLKEELAKTKIELEDTIGFKEQETQAKETLKKERASLKREITSLKKKLKEKNNGE